MINAIFVNTFKTMIVIGFLLSAFEQKHFIVAIALAIWSAAIMGVMIAPLFAPAPVPVKVVISGD